MELPDLSNEAKYHFVAPRTGLRREQTTRASKVKWPQHLINDFEAVCQIIKRPHLNEVVTKMLDERLKFLESGPAENITDPQQMAEDEDYISRLQTQAGLTQYEAEAFYEVDLEWVRHVQEMVQKFIDERMKGG